MQMPGDIGPVHVVGVGGIGMSAIAEILHAKGYTVQGSDQKDSANVRRLRAKGIRVFVGHDPVNLVGRALHRHLDGGEAGQPRARRGARQGAAHHPPRRDAGRADAPLCDGVGHRHARQDHHHLADRPRVQCGRPRPDGDHRRHHQRVGLQRPARQRRLDDRGGRRIGRHLHQDPDPDRRRHQHRPGASRLLQDGREHAPRVRDVLPQHSLLRPGGGLHRPSRGERDDRAPGAAPRRPPPRHLRHVGIGRHRAEVGARGRYIDHLRRRSRRARARRRPHHPRLEHSAVRASQCAQRAGGVRRGQRGRHRRRRDPQGHRRLLRRQAALPADRHLERRVRLRRLRPPSSRDRRRAEGGPRRCAWPRHRAGRAASLHARARPVRSTSPPASRMPTR